MFDIEGTNVALRGVAKTSGETIRVLRYAFLFRELFP